MSPEAVYQPKHSHELGVMVPTALDGFSWPCILFESSTGACRPWGKASQDKLQFVINLVAGLVMQK